MQRFIKLVSKTKDQTLEPFKFQVNLLNESRRMVLITCVVGVIGVAALPKVKNGRNVLSLVCTKRISQSAFILESFDEIFMFITLNQ